MVGSEDSDDAVNDSDSSIDDESAEIVNDSCRLIRMNECSHDRFGKLKFFIKSYNLCV